MKKKKSIGQSSALSSSWYGALKRVLDIFLGVCLVLCFFPVMVGVAIAIRLDSKGPAFFKQIRIGRYGIPFQVYKFRTMTVESPTFGLKPISFQDERMTRLGPFLRTTSLDELPQLLNVIKGEMSLVGPRPEQPFLVEQYETWHRERLNVLPGLTGWWQVSGRKQPMHEFIDEDIYYVRNCSLMFDFRILVKTIRAILSRDGAI